MTDDTFELSRRKALAALGSVGAASAGAGLGTSAFFSDRETFQNSSLTAGSLDVEVAVSQHYVDWLPDTDTAGVSTPVDPIPAPQETDDAEMPASGETPDVRLGTGAAGRGETRARPIELVLVDDDEDDGDAEDAESDEPALEFAIGSKVNDVNGGVPPGEREESLCAIDAGGDDDDAERPIVDLDDVKPGDFGFVRFEFASCDNPAFVSVVGELLDSAENGTTEPERDDEDEVEGEVELLDEVQLAVVGDDVYRALAGLEDGETLSVDSGDGFAGDVPVTLGTLLRGEGPVTEPLEGDIPPEEGGGTGDRNCFSGATNHRRTLVWWLPVDHANEIQTDSARFGLGIMAEQCRHNDGSIGDAPVTLESDPSPDAPWLTAEVDPGPTTTVTVELDDEVYGDWPDNPTSYQMEVNVDAGTDGLGESPDDDFRFGYAGSGTDLRSGAGGYLRRNTGTGGTNSRTDVAAEDLDGFEATESGDRLTYTFEIDWTALAADDDAALSGPPSEIEINEVFGTDGGEGVQFESPSVDNATEASGTLSTGL
jgi:predicted ribosomally synthesized peptide with SipW-like signal peptide